MLARLRWLIELSTAHFRDGSVATTTAWNRFWFTPADPTTLCLIRVLAGAMLFYTHAIWTLDLDAFFGEQSWLSREVLAQANQNSFSWSLLTWCRHPLASSTSRTLRVSEVGENGFWMKGVLASRIPWFTTTSSV